MAPKTPFETLATIYLQYLAKMDHVEIVKSENIILIIHLEID